MHNKSEFLTVEGNPSLVRDMGSSAIINTDVSQIASYRQLRAEQKKKEQEQNSLKATVNNLENEMIQIKSSIDEIKYLLGALLNKNN